MKKYINKFFLKINMRRKLIKQGKSTMTVSLPSKWIEKNGLDSGDEIDVEENEGILTITVDGVKKTAKESRVNVQDKVSIIKNIIGSYYKMGYDKIHIRFKYSSEYAKLQKLSLYFTGMGIVEESSSHVVLKKIANFEENELENLIKRQFFQMILMLEDTIKSIREKDTNKLDVIILMDDDFTKLNDLSRRILIKKSEVYREKIAPLYTLLFQMEKIADEIKFLCQEAKNNFENIDEGLLVFLEDILKYVRFFFEYYLKFELEKFQIIKNKKNELNENAVDLIDKNKNIFSLVIYARNIVNLLYTLTGITMELNI
jgi:phosphate uptake regulator